MQKNSACLGILLAFFLTACDDNDDHHNKAPTAQAGANQSVDQNTTVTLSGSGTDKDGTIDRYTWTQTRGTPVGLSDSSVQNPSFVAPRISADEEFEVLGFELSVRDNDGATASSTVSVTVFNQLTVTEPGPPAATFYDGNLIGADYWSDEPQIFSAGVGFSDIVAIPGNELNEALTRQANGAWLSDIDCGEPGLQTRATTEQLISTAWVHQSPYGELKDDAIGLDGLPIVFSWPVDTRTIDLTDFKFTLNTGEILFPLSAGSAPNFENNERNVVVVFAEFSNRKKSNDPEARFPVKLEIVADETPLTLIGPNNTAFNAVGLTWETTTSPYDDNNGPRLVGAKLNHVGDEAIGEGVSSPFSNAIIPPNDEFVLYGGGDYRLRVLTTGGFSPDGVRGVLPTDYEKFFRIHVRGEDGNTVLMEQANVPYQVAGGTLTVVGLSDLGQAEGGDIVYDGCYAEDVDNYIDVILVGDEAAARNITHIEIPSLAGSYSAFYNPGGPGTTPYPDVNYTSPGPADLEPVIMALDNPMRVTRILTNN